MKARAILSLAGMAAATAALATPPMVAEFTKTYKPKPGSALAQASCGVCHVGMSPKLNPYGADLKKVLVKKTLNAAALKKIENKDSDKDKVKNGAEIKKGTLPGDPKSK